MGSVKELHRRTCLRFGDLVHAVADDQWHLPTPCSEWDVRQLVHHLTYEALWVPALMSGTTLEEVGDRFEGDVLGDDPQAAWDGAAGDEIAAVQAVYLGRTVRLSYGDTTAEDYAFDLTIDLLVHGWDLARAIGGDESLDPEAVEACYGRMAPHEDALKRTGLFGQKVVPPPDADLQTKLLALLGRVA